MTRPRQLLKGFARAVKDAEQGKVIKLNGKKFEWKPGDRLMVKDPGMTGLYLRGSAGGRKYFAIVARGPGHKDRRGKTIQGKQVWAEIPNGDPDQVTLEDAQAQAAEGIKRIKQGLEPFPAPEPEVLPDTLADIVFGRDEDSARSSFFTRHVLKSGLRSAYNIERAFRRAILPEFGDWPIDSIKRSDIAKLLDRVEDNSGPVQADHILAYLSKLFNWYATRHDDFVSPIIRGMGRSRSKGRARVLSDDEIRTLWPVWQNAGGFGALLQVALLTAQRRAKVAAMRWDDVDFTTGEWTIPTEEREKGNPGTLLLPDAVLDILRAQPRLDGRNYIFSRKHDAPVRGFSRLKARIDEAVEVDRWTIHDLRRTAKTLMQRARVLPHISEQVLGHVITGVEGVYDQHDYAEDKAAALVALAAQVNGVLNPPPANVVPIRSEAGHG